MRVGETHPNAGERGRAVERASAAFEASLHERLGGVSVTAATVAAEASPVLDALAAAICAGGDSPGGLVHREALALASLLGRGVAESGAPPTTSLIVADALSDALTEAGVEVGPRTRDALRGVLVEGHAAAQLEVLERRLARDAAEAISLMPIAPRAHLVVVAGAHDADLLDAALEDIARKLLASDAAACLVLFHPAGPPRADVLRALLGLDASARMIGARAVFVGLDGEWVRGVEETFDLEVLERAESFAEGLTRVVEHVGHALRPEAPLLRKLRALTRSS